jgi:hypothetical protein
MYLPALNWRRPVAKPLPASLAVRTCFPKHFYDELFSKVARSHIINYDSKSFLKASCPLISTIPHSAYNLAMWRIEDSTHLVIELHAAVVGTSLDRRLLTHPHAPSER